MLLKSIQQPILLCTRQSTPGERWPGVRACCYFSCPRLPLLRAWLGLLGSPFQTPSSTRGTQAVCPPRRLSAALFLSCTPPAGLGATRPAHWRSPCPLASLNLPSFVPNTHFSTSLLGPNADSSSLGPPEVRLESSAALSIETPNPLHPPVCALHSTPKTSQAGARRYMIKNKRLERNVSLNSISFLLRTFGPSLSEPWFSHLQNEHNNKLSGLL